MLEGDIEILAVSFGFLFLLVRQSWRLLLGWRLQNGLDWELGSHIDVGD